MRQAGEMGADALPAGILELEAFVERVSALGQPPTPLEIVVKDLQYEVLVPDKQRSQQTVLSAMTWLCDTVQRKPFTVLSGVQARLRPGTLTLLLGGPSSGKSSLLQAIAGQLRPTPGATLQGTVTYNGQPATSLPMQRVVGLVQQYDNHLAHMTVRETLTFAYACQTGAGRQLPGLCRDVRLTSAQQAEVCAISAKRVDAVMEVLDLLHVADTLLGDDMTRGVSGGQRKRVTIGEFLVGNHKALLLDEMSNGLDSSKTLDIVRYLRRTARTMQITMMATLLQPAREVAAVFHESMLMYRGRVFYYGPWDTVESYFGNMGYHCPDARDFCDFLLDIATTAGRKDAGSDDSFDGLTTKWLAYEKTAAAAAGHTDVAVLDAAPLRCGGAYTVSLSTALGQVIGRDVRVMRTNPIDVVRRNVQCLIMGVICGTLFWNISKSDVMQQGSRFGSFFLVGIILLPGQIPAVPLIVNRAATFYKHRDGGFYPPVASAVSMMVQQLPTSIVAEGLIVTTTMYFLSNRSSDPVTYALSVVLNAMFGIMASQVVRTVASWVNSAALGQVLCGIFMVSTVVFSGFIITFDNLPIYWQWLYWGLPFSWYMRAMAIGEFSSSDYDARMPDGQRRGDLFLQMFSFKTQRYWIWYGMLLLAGWTALWFIVQTAVLTYKRRPAFFTTRKDTAEASDAAASSTTVAVAMASSVTDHKDLQSAPVVLSFTDVHYYVADPAHPKSGRELHLLDAVFGVFRPKTMTALMGSSGAGKTTLMDVLASRKTTGRVAGCVLVNGQPKEERSFARMIGYVEQMDIHNAQATVREAVVFSARLRNAAAADATYLAHFTHDLLEQMDLTFQAAQAVGLTTPEQRKRITMGVEMAANPSVLFLDEPTSGLDSAGANLVVKVMSKACALGKTLVCTIHQPSSAIFYAFDSLLLLKPGGRMVYFGSLGHEGRAVVDFLSAQKGVRREANQDNNPAAWMLEVLAEDTGGDTDLADAFAASALARDGLAAAHAAAVGNGAAVNQGRDTPAPKNPAVAGDYAADWIAMLRMCSSRAMLSYWRNPGYNAARIGFSVVVGAMFASLWARKGESISTQSDLQTAFGGVFIGLMFPGIVNFVTVVPVQLEERAVFYRERASHTYSVTAYFIATGLAELPFLLLCSFIFSTIYYTALAGAALTLARFCTFWFFFFALSASCTYAGQMAAILLPSAYVATVAGMMFASLMGQLCGFMQPATKMPEAWLFLHYANVFRWPLEGIITSLFEGRDDRMQVLGLACEMGGCKVSQYIHDVYDFRFSRVPLDIVMCVVLIVVFRLAALFGLWRVSYMVR